MDHETLGGRIPKGERRVRFADSMGMELVSIFLTDLFVLASHTPYTNYSEHRKPPSSRLSSTLQAIQYSHDHHHNQHHHPQHSHSHSHGKSALSAAGKATSNNNKQAINNNNNNNHFSSYNNYHSSGYHNRNHAEATSAASKHHYYQPALPPPAFKQSTAAPAAAASAAAAAAAAATAAASSAAALPAPSAPTEFICEFTQPVSLISFKERVKLKKVHLENCYVNTTAGHVSLTCNIRVLNVSYDKSVSVRYTTDDWASCTDSLASYKPGSSDGWSDQFTSTISIINKLQPGQRIIFAVRFVSAGTTFWDNNGGLNYSVKSKSDRSN